jgi:hypothetical protein
MAGDRRLVDRKARPEALVVGVGTQPPHESRYGAGQGAGIVERYFPLYPPKCRNVASMPRRAKPIATRAGMPGQIPRAAQCRYETGRPARSRWRARRASRPNRSAAGGRAVSKAARALASLAVRAADVPPASTFHRLRQMSCPPSRSCRTTSALPRYRGNRSASHASILSSARLPPPARAEPTVRRQTASHCAPIAPTPPQFRHSS